MTFNVQEEAKHEGKKKEKILKKFQNLAHLLCIIKVPVKLNFLGLCDCDDIVTYNQSKTHLGKF